MIRVKEAIVVEGKYDKIKLSSLVEGVIIETKGFGIFQDREKLAYLRALAKKRGLIVLTDSDGAGFLIRGKLSSSIPPEQIKHAYIPDILGKERRKAAADQGRFVPAGPYRRGGQRRPAEGPAKAPGPAGAPFRQRAAAGAEHPVFPGGAAGRPGKGGVAMDLTKELLAGASFRAKGKWYAAQQVDAFLEELSVRLEEDSREREELAEDARALRRENARLREELAAAKAAPPAEALPPEDPRLPVCRDLERERDSLLQDIKALRRFRESFRQAVEEDAQSLLRQVEGLPSEKLL